jgi:hypothetical protein
MPYIAHTHRIGLRCRKQPAEPYAAVVIQASHRPLKTGTLLAANPSFFCAICSVYQPSPRWLVLGYGPVIEYGVAASGHPQLHHLSAAATFDTSFAYAYSKGLLAPEGFL